MNSYTGEEMVDRIIKAPRATRFVLAARVFMAGGNDVELPVVLTRAQALAVVADLGRAWGRIPLSVANAEYGPTYTIGIK